VEGVYFWVGEQAFNLGTAFVDTMDSASSDILDSVPYDPPPADLHSLVGLPNGSFAGASGLDLRLTPAYKPYAWHWHGTPEGNELIVQFPESIWPCTMALGQSHQPYSFKFGFYYKP